MEHLKILGRELALGAQGISKEFLDLVKGIGECKSKSEEDRIILSEIEVLKKKIGEPDIPKKKMKEYIMRLMYIELLGHDASFGYIHAVKMTHDDNLLLKRTGYLAVTVFLEENHDLIILIVNTIQKDLKSDNHLVVCAALSAVCKLISEETIPAVLPQIVDLLTHPKEVVRKKAIMALHRFYQRSPSAVSHIIPKFRQGLADKDPSVMSAAVCALYDLIVDDAKSFKNLTGSFLNILKQVAECRLPAVYNYHKTPAPFVQIKLLKVLALLGANDRAASEHMYGVLGEVLRRADSAVTIGNAIIYECCCTITTIVPNEKLLGMCAESISRLLKSDNHNLKYMGIDALGRIVKIDPSFGAEHQLAVIDCLEDPDLSLQRQTLELLYSMTGGGNVEVIVGRMLAYLRGGGAGPGEERVRGEIAGRVIQLAEQFAPTNYWFIQTMNAVFELAGDLVRPSAAHDLMRLIAEGSGEEDETADSVLRSSAVQSYLQLLREPNLPSILLQVICWVLGEYGTLDGTQSTDDIIGRLCDLAESHSEDDTVRGYVITAISKISAFEVTAGKKFSLPPEAQSLLDETSDSHSTDLQQRAYELRATLALNPKTLASVLPLDASCEDIQVDASLSFLDRYVQEALSRGAQAYVPEPQRLEMGLASSLGSIQEASSERTLRFEAYERPSAPPPPRPAGPPPLALSGPATSASLQTVETRRGPGGAEGGDSALKPQGGVRLQLEGVQRKWGKPVYSSQGEAGTAGRGEEASGSLPAGLQGQQGEPQAQERYGRKAAPQVPEVSEEKRRLAASLFGGGEGAPSAGVSAVRRSAVRSQSAKSAASSALQAREAPAQQVAPPPPDLLDFGSEETSVDLVKKSQPKSAADPMKDLEGLLAPAARVEGGQGSGPKAGEGQVDLLSLYDEIEKAHFDSDGVQGSSKGSASAEGARKGASSAVERDAKIRQVGVVPGGDNPELLKGIFG